MDIFVYVKLILEQDVQSVTFLYVSWKIKIILKISISYETVITNMS